ncbi:MAG: hypothetical protein KKB50_18960 [Planctomycetes bacterium]|nr:hypothetical protein [Planctomycetota bacterium]
MQDAFDIGEFRFDVAVYMSDATFFRPVAWTRNVQGAISDCFVNGDGPEQISEHGLRVALDTRQTNRDLVSIRAHCQHRRPIKAVKFALDLPYMKMLAPELIDLPEATWRQWDFPCHWRTGFAVWQAAGRYFTIATRDFPWRFKRLRVLRNGDRMRLEIVQDAAARERSCAFETSTWEIGYRAQFDDLLDDYADFVRQAYGAGDFARRRDAPDWLRGVGLVVNLHGTDWNGRSNLDFAGMRSAADLLAEAFPPARTILYPIGWDGRYMRQYPSYCPSDGLGGHAGFRRFCGAARAQGFHIMPHLNAMAANMCHPLYLRHLKDYVLRDANGVAQHSHKIDWDHDGLGDSAHAYISLTPPGLREILLQVVDRLVAEYAIDAVFLDETCNVFYNDPAWDQVEGVRRLVRDLRRHHPELLIAGEEWNEMLLGLTPLVQIWEETADGRRGFDREKSPLLRRWAGRFIRSCGYLALASPDGTTGVHEWPDKAWVAGPELEAYYIPTLSLTDASLTGASGGFRATIAQAEAYVQRYASG